jgi:AbrB family looped-hinge helix DNA binding protein
MSSKGQIVIPENIRTQLDLHVGAQFIVMAKNDVVILKRLSLPNLDNFQDLSKKARKIAKSIGLTSLDINQALQEARKK